VSDQLEARLEGLGLGLGLAAGATLCWALPAILGAEAGWSAAGRIAAWVLYTIAAGGSLIELERTSGRLGFSDLGAAAVTVSIGAGLLALGSQVFSGPWAIAAILLGVGFMVVGLAGAGIGVGRMASGRPRPSRAQTHKENYRAERQARGFTRAETVAIALAAAQVALAAIALFR
jgi:hypothetical protein